MAEPSCCGLCSCPPASLWPMMSGGEVSFTKRAAAELSRRLSGLAVKKDAKGSGRRSRYRSRLDAVPHARSLTELWLEPAFLSRLFRHVPPRERGALAQVCSAWREVLYQPKFWRGVTPVLDFRRNTSTSPAVRQAVLRSLDRRCVDSLALFGCGDRDAELIVEMAPPSLLQRIRQLAVRCSGVTDRGLELLLSSIPSLAQLELSGCNEATEAGLWAGLSARVVSLSLADCIHVTDDTVAAVARLLPSLYELDLQAYHVTDHALALLVQGSGRGSSLRVLRLRSCWELTDRGVALLCRGLPRLACLSLQGCSRLGDEAALSVAAHLGQLRALDLGWCPRITDSALEAIACELTQLEELTLDRCVLVSDAGLGYLSTMPHLCALYLRWCSQVRDYGVRHLAAMPSLQVLSLAGCSLLTANGLASLTQLRHLQELELTNCKGASKELVQYLRQNLPRCLIVE